MPDFFDRATIGKPQAKKSENLVVMSMHSSVAMETKNYFFKP